MYKHIFSQDIQKILHKINTFIWARYHIAKHCISYYNEFTITFK